MIVNIDDARESYTIIRNEAGETRPVPRETTQLGAKYSTQDTSHFGSLFSMGRRDSEAANPGFQSKATESKVGGAGNYTYLSQGRVVLTTALHQIGGYYYVSYPGRTVSGLGSEKAMDLTSVRGESYTDMFSGAKASAASISEVNVDFPWAVGMDLSNLGWAVAGSTSEEFLGTGVTGSTLGMFCGIAGVILNVASRHLPTFIRNLDLTKAGAEAEVFKTFSKTLPNGSTQFDGNGTSYSTGGGSQSIPQQRFSMTHWQNVVVGDRIMQFVTLTTTAFAGSVGSLASLAAVPNAYAISVVEIPSANSFSFSAYIR